jgi:release factor glutamine methyltransferase
MFEPHRALDGGSDGLDGYRSLAPCLAGSLASTGYGVLEIGLGQAAWVKKIMQNSGLKVINRVDDLASIPRVLLVQRLR